jgi:adhesin/invasin
MDANGNQELRGGDTVSFSSDGSQHIGSTHDNGDGTYKATVTSTTKAGQYTITASDRSFSGSAKLTQTPGTAANASVTLNPTSITADGASTTTATATITDANGNPRSGDTVSFTSDGGQRIGSVTDNHDGTYTTTVTSTTKAGSYKITASDGSASGNATLTQTPGPATSVKVALNPSSIVADGKSTSTATATVADANGNARSGDTVSFTSDGGQSIGSVTDNGDGTYSATVTSTTKAGSYKITASDGSASGNATLTQTPGPATSVKVALKPASIVADGKSTAVATATVTDANANLRSGDKVSFLSDGGQHIGTTKDNGDGTYSASVTSTTRPGTYKITATDGSVTPAVSGSATLTQTQRPAPVLSTGPASRVKAFAATLNGTVNPEGSAATYHFEYGTSPTYGSSTPEQPVGSDDAAHPESQAISKLRPKTTYHFRIVATNAGGTTLGQDQVFTTRAPRFGGTRLRAATASVGGNGIATVAVSCPRGTFGGCRGTLTLQLPPPHAGAVAVARRIVLGSSSFSIAAGRHKAIKVRLSRHAMQLLRSHNGTLIVGALIQSHDAAGDHVKRLFRVRLTARGPSQPSDPDRRPPKN